MQCVILAGGFGMRMLPLTANSPKALIDINGKPFIYHQLEWITRFGIDNILLSIGHLGNMIANSIGNSFNNIPISYVNEGETLLGTAGALKLASMQSKLDDNFIVTYGDSFLPIDYSKPFNYFIANNIAALMTIYKNHNLFDKSNVVMNDSEFIYDKKRSSKPIEEFNYIDYGLSVINKTIIDTMVPPNTKFGLADLFHKLSADKILKGYEVFDRFFEIGSFEGLNDLKEWDNARRANST